MPSATGLKRIVRLRRIGALALLTAGCNTVLNNQDGELEADGGVIVADAGVASSLDAFVSPEATPDAGTVVSTDAGSGDAAPPDAAAPSPPPIDSGTLPTCAFDQKMCNGSCVGLNDPLFGCGAATCSACSLDHAAATCDSSGCAVAACNAGYADCDQTAANGCESDLAQSSHCGTCNAQCGASAPDCTPTSAGFACANGCSGIAPTLCGDQCVDLSSALDNCGSCGNACPAVANGQASCSSGACGFVCQADFHACGTACATDLSPQTCGTSCAPCPTGPNAIPTCNGESCGIACQPSFGNCNGLTSDGCETNFTSDPANCGVCSNACPSGSCVASACVPLPPPPPPDAGTPPPPVDAGPPPVDASTPVEAATTSPAPDAASASDAMSE